MSAPIAQMLPNQAPPHPHPHQPPPPITCAENPIFFNGTDIGAAFLTDHAINPDHSNTINPCANIKAHTNAAGQLTPYHVCSTCRTQAHTHILRTSPHLLSNNNWPLCQLCSRYERQIPVRRPANCICDTLWLCYACRDLQLKFSAVRGEVDGNLLGNVNNTASRKTEEWICRCEQRVAPFAGFNKCAGCGFLARGNWGVHMVVQRLRAYAMGLGWT